MSDNTAGPMRRRPPLRRVIVLLLPTLAVAVAVLYLGISYMIASSLTDIDRKPLEDSPASHGLAYEDVEFSPPDADISLSGWYISAEAGSKVVVLVHGHNGNREESGDFLDLSRRLALRGYGILLFDLRGHGESEGDRVSYGYFERNDIAAALVFLAARGIPADDVGVLGMSMGAGTALLGAAEAPSPAALVADSPYARATDLIAREIGRQTPVPGWLAPVFVPGGSLLARLLYDIDVDALAPEEAAETLDFPILVIHGGGDTRIPSSHGRRVHEAAQPGSELWVVPEVEHTDAFPTYPDEYVERVVAYLESRLGSQ